MLGTINDPNVTAAIGSLFGGAASHIRGFAGRSETSQEDGELPAIETSMTDVLVDMLRTSVRERLTATQDELAQRGVDLSVRFDTIRPPGESQHGADIGIRATVQTQGFVATKACLVQCKRMYGPRTAPTFKEVRGRGETQAQDMLHITPASFFMLYNFLDQETLLGLSGVPAALMCPAGNQAVGIRHEGRLAECMVFDPPHPLWDLGVAMLPATRILALSAGAVLARHPMPIDAAAVLPGAWPFGAFVVDLLGGCVVGDPRSEVVQIATSPARWAEETATVGLTSSAGLSGFAVRHTIDLKVSTQAGGNMG